MNLTDVPFLLPIQQNIENTLIYKDKSESTAGMTNSQKQQDYRIQDLFKKIIAVFLVATVLVGTWTILGKASIIMIALVILFALKRKNLQAAIGVQNIRFSNKNLFPDLLTLIAEDLKRLPLLDEKEQTLFLFAYTIHDKKERLTNSFDFESCSIHSREKLINQIQSFLKEDFNIYLENAAINFEIAVLTKVQNSSVKIDLMKKNYAGLKSSGDIFINRTIHEKAISTMLPIITKSFQLLTIDHSRWNQQGEFNLPEEED